MRILAADRLIVALDVSDVAAARTLVAELGDHVQFYKVGLELAYAAGGFEFARELAHSGKKLFIDLKLHDIPNTVERAANQIARLGATFLTVHAYPQTMVAARAGVADRGLKLLAVTVMTSYDDVDLAASESAFGVRDLVARRALQARDAGMDGLILSAGEVVALRETLGPDLLLVTPGIRPAGAAIADQKRVMTPARAIAAGADHLVVGRPITQARDPAAEARAIQDEIAAACAARDVIHA